MLQFVCIIVNTVHNIRVKVKEIVKLVHHHAMQNLKAHNLLPRKTVLCETETGIHPEGTQRTSEPHALLYEEARCNVSKLSSHFHFKSQPISEGTHTSKVSRRPQTSLSDPSPDVTVRRLLGEPSSTDRRWTRTQKNRLCKCCRMKQIFKNDHRITCCRMYFLNYRYRPFGRHIEHI